jgi:transketolase
MRDSFIKELTKIAKDDKNVILLTGDLGFGVLNNFTKELPEQFINIGVAEQNMTGIAVGMALEGKIVFTYSICNFPTLRCLEQIRNDACYHQANVKIIAIGGGFCYGSLGISHHATEDLSIMRALPNITVVAPGDIVEVADATRAIYNTPGVCYLRIGRGGGKKVHEEEIDFKVGKAIQIFNGEDVALISTGGILENTFKARKMLNEVGLSVGLYSMHTIKPFDRELVEDIAKRVKLIVTIEEHTVIGGLGGAVSEILAQMPQPRARLQMVGLPGCFSSVVGDQEYLRGVYGMSIEGIVEKVKEAFNK